MDVKKLVRSIREKADEAMENEDEAFVYVVVGGKYDNGELHTISLSNGKGISNADFLTYILSDLSMTANKLGRQSSLIVDEGEQVLEEKPDVNPN